MMTFTLDNPTGKTSTRALLSLLRHALGRNYSIVFALNRDPVVTRAHRTRSGVVEVELYEDGSGLEVACFGRWLLVGVETKRGAVALPQS